MNLRVYFVSLRVTNTSSACNKYDLRVTNTSLRVKLCSLRVTNITLRVRQYLKKKDIQFCTANNEPKASAVERVNQTLKSKLYCYFTVVNSLSMLRRCSARLG